MAKVTATAKQTIMGSYGLASAGDTIVLDKKHAEQLEAQGAIEITGDADDDEVSEKESSLRITDNTGKPKEKAETETDDANPTGAKEKKDAAGPNAKKAADKGKKK